MKVLNHAIAVRNNQAWRGQETKGQSRMRTEKEKEEEEERGEEKSY